MNLKEKGWLRNYLDYRHKEIAAQGLESYFQSLQITNGKEESFYAAIQPSGLMYGHPVNLPMGNLPKFNVWGEKDRMKAVLLESLIHSDLMLDKSILTSPNELKDYFDHSAIRIGKYYQNIYPRLLSPANRILRRRRSEFELSEYALARRLELKSSWINSFWTSFFHNSFLFLDVFYFSSWQKPMTKSYDLLIKEKEEMRFVVLKVIAAAAFANGSISREEKALFKSFLQSAQLSTKKQKEAWELINDGVDLDEIEFSVNMPWLLKKYMLELALLTIWSDQNVSEDEEEFIRKLSIKLEFEGEDLDYSVIAIESFVAEHWDQIHYLQAKSDWNFVSNRMITRLNKIVHKNRRALANEIRESKELVSLLNKSRTHSLTIEEKEKVRQQLLDVLKTIPTFVIIALPGTFLTLPILLKILPKSAFPSSFRE